MGRWDRQNGSLRATPSNVERDDSTGVLTRSRRAQIRSVQDAETDPMRTETTETSSDTSSSDSVNASDDEIAVSKDQSPGEEKGRTRMCQGGPGFADLTLPPADLSGWQKTGQGTAEQEAKGKPDLCCRLADANTALMLSALPQSLPCRDDEKQHIQDVLDDFFSQRTGRSLYICGVPGTGKTATTMEVVDRYRSRPDTKFVLLNCLSMASAQDLYSALYTNLFGQEAGKKASLAQLNQFFRETEELTVLILDEMDVLLTKKSTELYNLFEWCWEGGRLCILGISNTVNLPKRLPAAVQKFIPSSNVIRGVIGLLSRRMGTNTLTFKPYTKQQMEWIVQDRLGDSTVFHDMAIQRAAAKVAHANGDVRRCLQLLQLTIDIFQRSYIEQHDIITAHHVGDALFEMFGDDILSDLDTMEKLLLASFLFSRRALSNDEQDGVSAQEILQRVKDSARLSDVALPSDAFLLNALQDLHTAGIINIEDSHKRLFERASLNVSETDVTKSIAQDHRLERLNTSLRM